MKLLLRRDVQKLGLAGDVVEVKEGYARNYLIPQQIAVLPTDANMKRIEEDKRLAALERAKVREALEAEAARMRDVEVTIAATCNVEGHLYGSVGPREIAAALRNEGHSVETKQVQLHEPIKRLDTVTVPVKFTDDLTVEVKVWVVREEAGGLEEEEPIEAPKENARKEAGNYDRGTGVDALDLDL
jgi:large subunit ribosomal protein L9